MTRPTTRPDSTSHQYRRRIPADVQDKAKGLVLRIPIADAIAVVRLGASAAAVKVSLRTRDPHEAKARTALVSSYLDLVWKSLRDGPRKLTHKETVSLAGEMYRAFTVALEDNPGSAAMWRGVLDVNKQAREGRFGTAPLRIGDGADRLRASLEQRFGGFVDVVFSRRGLIVDAESRTRLLKEMATSLDVTAERLLQLAGGDYSPDRAAQRFPDWPDELSDVSVRGLLQGYLKELRASGKRMVAAEKSWTPAFNAFVAFLGHDDAAKVTTRNVVAWKEKRLETRAPKTVKDTDLAALRAVFRWATENTKLDANPAQGVRLQRKQRSRERGFTLEEANAILSAALAYQPGARERAPMTAAKRWTPWLCAYTGARIAELTQLRKEDVRREGLINYLRITPDAGSVKSGNYRDVPIHPHLVELGFLGFVEAAADGPLFYIHSDRRRATSVPAQQVAGRVSRWLQARGLVPGGVQPNHGWRHRFKTVALELSLDARVVDAIQGHAPRTAGEDYGNVTLKARRRQIVRIPRYDANAVG